ncbi:MAG: phenylalanine--tRNA ligase subunit alpha [Methylotenera sp.]|nr:phenylalanine--tRNA ligase subunit alpha [Oligoflexia bacterium]
MIQKLDAIGGQALRDIAAATQLDVLENVRISVLGKKGALSEVLKGLGTVLPEERPKMGAAANEWKRQIEEALTIQKDKLESAALNIQLAQERIDISLPARLPHRGALHPVTQTTRKLLQIFSRLGFDPMTGPEIETEFLNFEAVNIPKDHPARDMQDTFFMGPGVVLRTHTSAVQMRALRSKKWPVRIVCPGAVYRSDHDATHSPMFHQIEGLWVDKNVKMSDLKGTLEFFAQEMFGSESRIRLRPSYFPFVEPGAEVDVSCFLCKSKPVDTCKVCKGTGWLEILGAGMVHPRLFEMAGYDPGEVSGFAFGMGVERIAMLLHHIPDLRRMFDGDSRFLTQF